MLRHTLPAKDPKMSERMGPFIGLLILFGTRVSWGASLTTAIDTEDDIPDLNPELMTTISKLLGEHIELEKAQALDPSEQIKDALDVNLEQLKNALKGREDDLAVILAIIEDLKKAGNESVDGADEYRLGRKTKRKPCSPNSMRCMKPRFGRIIGQIPG
uniref:Putative conserved secreted protein n=1 Tax=Ixodes scapularis TaxID=6945 RepID=A0A4D5RPM1_IXOSC